MISPGCWNKPRPTDQSVLTVQDGYREYEANGAVVRVPVWKRIPFRMSSDCKYDKQTTDQMCSGCKNITKETP